MAPPTALAMVIWFNASETPEAVKQGRLPQLIRAGTVAELDLMVTTGGEPEVVVAVRSILLAVCVVVCKVIVKFDARSQNSTAR